MQSVDLACRTEPQEPVHSKITDLCRIRGIGNNFAAVLAREVFYRTFANRRQLASYVGITPMPYQSGNLDRDRRIGRAGNPRARTTMIQLAWLWLRYQPGSDLAEWFRKRVGTMAGAHQADRHRSHGAEIVDCAVALCRDRDHTGRRRVWRPCHGRNSLADGIAIGDITLTAMRGARPSFVIGGSFITAFQVGRASSGLASCMRHYGDGSYLWPDRM